MKRGLPKAVLTFLGIFAFIIGLAIILAGPLYLLPKARQITESADQSLGWAEESLEVASRNMALLESTENLGQSAASLTDLAPETLTALNGTLVQSAETLEGLGQTLDELTSGITGVVVPDPEAGKSAVAASKTADQLKLLAGMVEQMQEVSRDVAAQVDVTAERLQSVRADLSEFQPRTRQAAQSIQEIRETLAGMRIPLWVVGATSFCGGLYCLLGLLFLAAAGAYGRLDRISAVQGVAERPAGPRGRAA